ncbi:alpha/beta hydrolase [Rummeliibacillus sp. JY-2-4R]
MKKRAIWIIGLLTGIIGGAITLIGYLVSSRIIYIKKKDDDFILDREKKAMRYDEKWFETVHKETLSIDSPNGYLIKGIYFKPLDTANTMIVCHGVTENKVNSVKYVRLFERLGFNTVVYDHRRHGESGGKTTSYGYYEKVDLQAVLNYMKERVSDDATIGVHGESMGAATTILYAGTLEDKAHFYIADCPYSDFSEELYYLLTKQTPFKSPLAIRLANIFLRLRDGYWLKSVAPRTAVTNIDKPVLFIHSLPDDFILPSMTIELYRLKKGPKMLKLFEQGAHAQSFNANPQEYEDTVREFLHEYVMTNNHM